MLLPPLCPVAKGEKVLFVFSLEILDGNRAQSRSFWEVPKKCHCCHPIKLKKPEVTPGTAPMALKKPKVSLTTALVAQAILKRLELVEDEAMTGVKPSVSANPPPPTSIPLSFMPPGIIGMLEEDFIAMNPFPCQFD